MIQMGRRAGINFEKMVLELFLQGHKLRPVDIEKMLKISHPHVMRILRKFRERGWIRKLGNYYTCTLENPSISKKPDDPRTLLLYYFWLFQQRLKILSSMHIEGRSPYLRIPLSTYLKAYPEENVYAKFIEKPVEDIIKDGKLVKILVEEGMLKVEEKEVDEPVLKKMGFTRIVGYSFKEAEDEDDYGLFYKPIGPPQKIAITEDDVSRAVLDFLVKVGEIARAEAEKIKDRITNITRS